MKRAFLHVILLVSILAFAFNGYTAGFSQYADAIETAAKSVLKLVFVNEANEDAVFTGSGFIAFNDLTLVTNYHVIEGTTHGFASDDNDVIYEIAYVLCADKKADIAILELSRPSGLKPLGLFPDNQLKRGSPVVAIGSPEGLKNVVSTGIISSQFVDDYGIPEIQITAPISHGSSGGALLNDNGNVIGVTSASYASGQNLNFAVNIAVVQAMYNAWDGKKYTLVDHTKTAQMDFSGVYETGIHDTVVAADNSADIWTCSKCGHENTTLFCQECGNERPYWICSCGTKNNDNKFCGKCGKSLEEQIEIINNSFEMADRHLYTEAIDALSMLRSFSSGTNETCIGDHVDVEKCRQKVRYLHAFYLLESKQYKACRRAFAAIADYENASEMIDRAYYEEGMQYLEQGDHEQSIELFEKSNNYAGVAERRIQQAYFEMGEEAYKNGKKDEALQYYEKAGDYANAKSQIYIINESKRIDYELVTFKRLSHNFGIYKEQPFTLKSIKVHDWGVVKPDGSLATENKDIWAARDQKGYDYFIVGDVDNTIFLIRLKDFCDWNDDVRRIFSDRMKFESLKSVTVSGVAFYDWKMSDWAEKWQKEQNEKNTTTYFDPKTFTLKTEKNDDNVILYKWAVYQIDAWDISWTK